MLLLSNSSIFNKLELCDEKTIWKLCIDRLNNYFDVIFLEKKLQVFFFSLTQDHNAFFVKGLFCKIIFFIIIIIFLND